MLFDLNVCPDLLFWQQVTCISFTRKLHKYAPFKIYYWKFVVNIKLILWSVENCITRIHKSAFSLVFIPISHLSSEFHLYNSLFRFCSDKKFRETNLLRVRTQRIDTRVEASVRDVYPVRTVYREIKILRHKTIYLRQSSNVVLLYV